MQQVLCVYLVQRIYFQLLSNICQNHSVYTGVLLFLFQYFNSVSFPFYIIVVSIQQRPTERF